MKTRDQNKDEDENVDAVPRARVTGTLQRSRTDRYDVQQYSYVPGKSTDDAQQPVIPYPYVMRNADRENDRPNAASLPPMGATHLFTYF